jgi:anti-anti-sigma factor
MKVEIVTEKISSGFMLKLKGDVDMNSSSDVRNARRRLQARRERHEGSLIDLSQVRYMDSSGIATLVECMQTA